MSADAFLSVFAECSPVVSSDDEEEVVPVKKENGLEKFAREQALRNAEKKPQYSELRIRSVDEALNERMSGLDNGYCDIDKKGEMDARRVQSDDVNKKGDFLRVVLKEIEDEFTQRGITKGQKIEKFNDIYLEIAIKQMRPALNDGEDLPLKKFEVDLYVMTGMMYGLFRGDEDYRYGSLLGRVSKQYAKRGFHTDAEICLLNEQTQKTNDQQALKRKLADEDEQERKEREREEELRMEQELEEQNDRELCEMLDAIQFDTDEYVRQMRFGVPEEEARRICKAEATKRRIEMEEARFRLPESSPPRSVADPSEWRDMELVEDDLANVNVYTGPTQNELFALIEKTKGFFAAPDDCEPVDMDISFDERDDMASDQQEVYEPPEPTDEEIAARERAINSMRNHARAQEQPDTAREIERYQRMRAERRAPSPVFGQQPDESTARGWTTESREEEQERAHYPISQSAHPAAHRREPRREEDQEPAHYPISQPVQQPREESQLHHAHYRRPQYGHAPGDGDDEHQPWVYRGDEQPQPWVYRGDEPVDYQPQQVQQRHADDFQRRLQLVQQQQQLECAQLQDARIRDSHLQLRDPRDPQQPHRNELSAREKRERLRYLAEQQKRAVYEAQQQATAAQRAMDKEEEDVEVVGVRRADRFAHLQPYKERLTLAQMKQMTRSRAEMERRKWEAPTQFAKITSCGQTDLCDDFLVHLDDNFEGAVREQDRPKVKFDLGVRKPKDKKSILRVKVLGNARPPVLLTDLHADKMPFPPTAEGAAMRKQLLRVQRANAAKPPKTVMFADERDPRNEIRVYMMQASQVPQEHEFDPTDDGYTRFHVTKQLCWQQDVLLLQSKKQNQGDNRYTPACSTLAYRKLADSCSTRGWFKHERRRNNHFLWDPLAVRVTPAEDPIFSRMNAKMLPGQERDPNYIELKVSHRDYKIIRAIKPMEDSIIDSQWLPQVRLFTTHAFECELNRKIGTYSPANSGLSYLVLADSLLDRVNTYRFPQTHFVIHQKPLNLSTSFRVLCDDIPFEKLLNIEYFVFAYGFDEILFGGQDPCEVANRVMDHCISIVNLVHEARAVLRHSHRYTIVPKYRIMNLPMHLMDDRLTQKLKTFNDYLLTIIGEFKIDIARTGKAYMEDFFPVQVIDWETKDIIGRTLHDGERREGRDYRYNCIESFAMSMRMHLNMRTLRTYPTNGDAREYHHRRMFVSGLSQKEFVEKY
uniref:Uncharacterized protein n=1 Tax=Pristionchus pacificus TaxID=54126 RepID=A0A8R1UIF2_PRIPA